MVPRENFRNRKVISPVLGNCEVVAYKTHETLIGAWTPTIYSTLQVPCANVDSDIFQSNQLPCGVDERDHQSSLNQGFRELEKMMHQHFSGISAPSWVLARLLTAYKREIAPEQVDN
jgi:hypothetical protein